MITTPCSVKQRERNTQGSAAILNYIESITLTTESITLTLEIQTSNRTYFLLTEIGFNGWKVTLITDSENGGTSMLSTSIENSFGRFWKFEILQDAGNAVGFLTSIDFVSFLKIE